MERDEGRGSALRIDHWDPRLTESRNPRTADIDRLDAAGIVARLQAEDRAVLPAVESEAPRIAELVDVIAGRLALGGRLIYVGAGTSGRLGVLDASECPPTFGTDPELVQGVIAGGVEALTRSREGVEDDRGAGGAAMDERGVGERDVVLGIATSGTTPYVHGALARAAGRGAATAFLSCTPPPEDIARTVDLCITPLVGPEAITGSTRLKAGTATKLVLNTLTTGAMVRLGKVHGNLMVDLRAVSRKLVDRGLRILEAELDLDRRAAAGLLLAAGGSVRVALAMRQLGCARARAERLLDMSDGRLRVAVERFGSGVAATMDGYSGFEPRPGPRQGERLVERFGEVAERIGEAVERGRRADSPLPGRWDEAAHLAHLLEFEAMAVSPRVTAWLDSHEPAFPDVETSDDPPRRAESVEALLEALDASRAGLAARMRAAGPAALERPASIGGVPLTLAQFLAGVVSHDSAHAARVSERPHSSLQEVAG